MRILHATTEFFPYIKVGGLSDMVASLSEYQAKKHEIHIAIPLLESIRPKISFSGKVFDAVDPKDTGHSDASKALHESRFLHAMQGKVNLYFFDSPVMRKYYHIYQNYDECYSFAVFSAACTFLARILEVDVVHAHDWHTALVPVLNNSLDPKIPTVFTIHNMAYQGDHPFWMTSFLRMDPFFIDIEKLVNVDKVNYMKGALMHAQEITTVSPGYRDEIMSEPEGFHLSWLLRERHDSFTGILNGINKSEWSPQVDKRIYFNYDIENVEEGKRKNKLGLYQEYGLHVDLERPLVGLIGRLTFQKGYETFLPSFYQKYNLPFYYFMLGTGEPHLESVFLHESHHSNQRLYFYKGFDEALARKIEAAADFFLMPSLFEPCGLNQMYSHSYGTIPIVSRVGGLKDSVHESWDYAHLTGFVFEPGQHHSLNFALERALTLYYDKEALNMVRKNIMKIDWSWQQSEKRYEKIYERAIHKGPKR